jgi:hypothetical protein
MDWCYRSALTGKTTEAAQAIMAVRRRAGEYVAALERASRTNAVDVECWSAWRQARASGDL